MAVLEAENRQLREEYARARQAAYRRTAVSLLIVGLLGIAGGVVFPDARTVLFALGGTGIFAGVLTYFITPERFISAEIGGRLFEAVHADREATIDELGLRGDPVYVPGDEVRLFVPRDTDAPLPESLTDLDLFVVPADPTTGGVAFHPTGVPLFEEFSDTMDQSLGTRPQSAAPVLADALVEVFELADSAESTVDTDTQRVTFEVRGAGLGDPRAIDHPIASFLSVSLVEALAEPVEVTVTEEDPLTVTCRYGHRE
ncbi:hypothetical protein DVK05_01440 [Halorubrum sp. Atlit-8R]|uniref:hypothetical protein n=1 Tax=unclassified Halorubrum TaxID=2642239 RepID=UPI000EF1FD88|nr:MULTISPECIES: hypothetical protein [unclassified Halorubrum]RLM71371.1 hypothetical protein DVK08_04325 [Halorubrum sp. Atlit-9R]RLM82477.1 hypothetical protein DVK05_01440 [Halorubrum sp. Atlit-8R]